MAVRPVKWKPNFLSGAQLAGVDLATTLAAKAALASPALTGTPTAPTAGAGTSTTQLATTAFVTTADNLKAPIANPTFTTAATMPMAIITAALAGTGQLRWLGTISGVPTGSAHVVGDCYVDRTYGFIWLCTAAGTPGSWVNIGGSGRIIGQATSDAFVTSGITAVQDISGLSIASFVVPTGMTATAKMDVPQLDAGGNGVSAVLTMTNSSNTVYSDATAYVYMAVNTSIYPSPTMKRTFTAGTYSLKGRIASLFGIASVGYGLTGDECRPWLEVTLD